MKSANELTNADDTDGGRTVRANYYSHLDTTHVSQDESFFVLARVKQLSVL